MKGVANSSAVLAIAALTARRFLRSRILWIAIGFACLPLLPFAFGAGEHSDADKRWLVFLSMLAPIQLLVTALLTAPAIAEEIEEKTYAYLWSRPIERWTVFAGKLLTASLLGLALFSASVLAGSAVTGYSDGSMIGRGVLGLGLGVIVAGSMAASFGTLLPKHPLAFSISYFLVLDLGVSAMPFAGARISVMHNVLAISGHGPDKDTLAASVLWLVGLACFWTLVGLWRLGRNELSTGS